MTRPISENEAVHPSTPESYIRALDAAKTLLDQQFRLADREWTKYVNVENRTARRHGPRSSVNPATILAWSRFDASLGSSNTIFRTLFNYAVRTRGLVEQSRRFEFSESQADDVNDTLRGIRQVVRNAETVYRAWRATPSGSRNSREGGVSVSQAFFANLGDAVFMRTFGVTARSGGVAAQERLAAAGRLAETAGQWMQEFEKNLYGGSGGHEDGGLGFRWPFSLTETLAGIGVGAIIVTGGYVYYQTRPTVIAAKRLLRSTEEDDA